MARTALGAEEPHNQLWMAEVRSGLERSSSTFNDSWQYVYNAIRNAKTVISKTEENAVEGDNTMARAVAEIMLAYNAAIATDMFGDTPYEQAG